MAQHRMQGGSPGQVEDVLTQASLDSCLPCFLPLCCTNLPGRSLTFSPLFPSYLQRTKVSCARQPLPRFPHCSSERSFPQVTDSKPSFHERVKRRLEKRVFFMAALHSLQGQTCVTQMLASPKHNETFSWKPPHRVDARALGVTAVWYFLPSESNKEGTCAGGS